MALFDVTCSKPDADLRGSILPGDKTRLFDRTNHYSFGTKTQEFAVPLGVDVSNPYLVRNKNIWSYPVNKADAAWLMLFTRHQLCVRCAFSYNAMRPRLTVR